MAPVKSKVHKTGRLSPDKHAKPKNGRKPTSQSGCADKFNAEFCSLTSVATAVV